MKKFPKKALHCRRSVVGRFYVNRSICSPAKRGRKRR